MESTKEAILTRVCAVYGLKDPRDDRVMYVGASTDVHMRYRSHMCSSSGGGYPKLRWVKELLRAGLAPELVVLEITHESALKDAETAWIKAYRWIDEAVFNTKSTKELA